MLQLGRTEAVAVCICTTCLYLHGSVRTVRYVLSGLWGSASVVPQALRQSLGAADGLGLVGFRGLAV